MNCKPGDLAVVVRDRMNIGLLGRICRVLRAAPCADFRLPDQYWHDACPAGFWVLDFDKPINVPLKTGRTRSTRFAVAHDAALRPIRPGEGEDEMLLLAGKPEGVTA